MRFSHQKQDVLSRADKSRKGGIDEDIREVVGIINSMDNYYTTSSCSGRIVLIERRSDKKNDGEWMYVTHGHADIRGIKEALTGRMLHEVWFKQESMILHVCCKTIDDAKALIEKAQSVIKRAGIMSLGNNGQKIMVEIIGSEFMDTIIAKDGAVLVSDDYLEELVLQANRRQDRNKDRIRKLAEKLG